MDELVKAEFDRMTDENVRQNHRIDVLEGKVEKLNEIALSIKELTINMKHMLESQNEMKTDIEEIKSKPAQAWDKAVWIIVTGVLSCVVGYALKSIGL